MKENNWLNNCKKNITSQHGEDGIIEKILEILPGKDNWCVEFGAWDGKHDSNTYNLINNKAYSAILIEGNKERFEKLRINYENNQKVNTIHSFVGFDSENNLDKILNSTRIPEDFDLLSIDVDGNDYHIWKTINLYKPKVVVIEFNPTIPNEVKFVQEPNTKLNYGCSLASIVHLGKKKKYELVATTLNNAVFIDSKYFELFEITNNSIEFLRDDKSRLTHIFSGYDGTVFIRGYGKVDLHGIPFHESRMQQLPKFLRGWSDENKFKLLLRRIFISLKKRKII